MGVGTGFKVKAFKYFWSTSETVLYPESGLCGIHRVWCLRKVFAVCHVGGIFLS